jgi:dTDP-D-glucose 4,6-dehydratase
VLDIFTRYNLKYYYVTSGLSAAGSRSRNISGARFFEEKILPRHHGQSSTTFYLKVN